jgi:transcriptional regulator with XRE-family HTH domain
MSRGVPPGIDFPAWVRMRTRALMARAEPPLSQRKLAKWIGVDRAQLNRFLNGKEGWPLYRVQVLAAAFGMTVGEFFEPLIRQSVDAAEWKRSRK